MNRIEEVKKRRRRRCKCGKVAIAQTYAEGKPLCKHHLREHICQLFPQPLPDEKLRKALDEYFAIDIYGMSYEHLREELRHEVNLSTTSVIAFFQPKIEEAKEQERERLKSLLTPDSLEDLPASCRACLRPIVQALKGKG